MFLVWFQRELERQSGRLRIQPKFRPSFWARRKLNLLNLANIDLPSTPCCHIVIYIRKIAASFSSISTAFSLLDSIEGFLFRCKSTIPQPSHAVSGLKNVLKQSWQKQEVFLTRNFFGVVGKAACSLIEPSTDLILLHTSDKKESDLS